MGIVSGDPGGSLKEFQFTPIDGWLLYLKSSDKQIIHSNEMNDQICNIDIDINI
jgi:hypothetical protein